MNLPMMQSSSPQTQAMPKTAPERTAKMSEMMKDRSQDKARMADAVNVFYATLTNEQKTAFDKVYMSQMSKMDRGSHKARANQPRATQQSAMMGHGHFVAISDGIALEHDPACNLARALPKRKGKSNDRHCYD